VVAHGARYFLRLYEEQDLQGARAEAARTEQLRRRGVPTPAAIGEVTPLAARPAVLLVWIEGTHSCQRGVSPARARAVGEALAKVHRAGESVHAPQGRFTPAALSERLVTIEASALAAEAPRLRAALGEVVAARATTPTGLIHGDLFRDNVLWDGDHLIALLDFESASLGSYVFDLAVALLAWCFGDAFEAPLMRAMVQGYVSVRPLDDAERAALWNEARFAAVRFTITRITDYALRAEGSGVMKDFRRFEARLQELEKMGTEGFRALVG